MSFRDASTGLDYAINIEAFIDQYIRVTESGAQFSLAAHHRKVLKLALRFDSRGRLLLRLLLWGEMKKSAKTFLAALIAIWWAVTRSTEVTCYANDLDQSVGRVFATVVALLQKNGFETNKLVKIRATEVKFSNGSVIRAVASDYKGEAGGRQTLAIFDELWGFDSERAERLFEEATPIPTAESAWVLVVTTAGFTGESSTLERLYARGLAGERIDDDLEVYRDGEYTMFWSHTPRQKWQTPQYYAEQRKSLRPGTYKRLHENQWVSSESTFITPELYDACVDAGLTAALADRDLEIDIGVDASQKSDWASVQAVAWQGERLQLVTGKVWRPSKANPLDLESTIERFVHELDHRFSIRSVRYDPWQLARSAATLKAAGIPMVEFTQTEAHVGQMGSTLYDLLKNRNLVLYADDDLRTCCLNAVAKEHARGGLAMTKKSSGKKIDAAAALAMACVGALEAGPDSSVPLTLVGSPTYHEWEESEQARGGVVVDDDPDEPEEDDVFEMDDAVWDAMSPEEQALYEVIE